MPLNKETKPNKVENKMLELVFSLAKSKRFFFFLSKIKKIAVFECLISSNNKKKNKRKFSFGKCFEFLSAVIDV